MEQNKKKIDIIAKLCEEVQERNNLYAAPDKGGHFDYDTVIELLKSTLKHMDGTLRFSRPEDLPKDVPWSEIPYSPDDEFDPFVFDGSMSINDYEMHERMEQDA